MTEPIDKQYDVETALRHVPKGFRVLKDGEKVRESDAVWNGNKMCWQKPPFSDTISTGYLCVIRLTK